MTQSFPECYAKNNNTKLLLVNVVLLRALVGASRHRFRCALVDTIPRSKLESTQRGSFRRDPFLVWRLFRGNGPLGDAPISRIYVTYLVLVKIIIKEKAICLSLFKLFNIHKALP